MPKDTLIYLFLGFISLIFSIFLFFSGIAIPGATVSLKFDYIGYILLSLGGASAIYFTLIAKDAFEKGITFFSFLLSGLFSSRHFHYTRTWYSPLFFLFYMYFINFFLNRNCFYFFTFLGVLCIQPMGIRAIYTFSVPISIKSLKKKRNSFIFVFTISRSSLYIWYFQRKQSRFFNGTSRGSLCNLFFFLC